MPQNAQSNQIQFTTHNNKGTKELSKYLFVY